MQERTISDLGFSPRLRNVLTAFGITDIDYLAAHREDDLLRIPGIGRSSVEEIKRAISHIKLA